MSFKRLSRCTVPLRPGKEYSFSLLHCLFIIVFQRSQTQSRLIFSPSYYLHLKGEQSSLQSKSTCVSLFQMTVSCRNKGRTVWLNNRAKIIKNLRCTYLEVRIITANTAVKEKENSLPILRSSLCKNHYQNKEFSGAQFALVRRVVKIIVFLQLCF